MLSNFPQIVKKHLKKLPTDDYPVLNTFLFVSIWLEFVLDKSQESMRSVFKHLNVRGIDVDISTFSKASKVREPKIFYELFIEVRKSLKSKKNIDKKKLALFPLDSTIVTLTSKLLWSQGFHQVKLFSGLNLLTEEPGGISIHFGQGHDSKYGNETIEETPENGVGVMDRGFASLLRIQYLLTRANRYFVLRIKNNVKVEMLDNGRCLIGTGKEQVEARVVQFCDRERRCEFRLVTNLPEGEEIGISNEEISDIYRLRWQIELFWKFLKMHLKLDKLITKNINGIQIQIYTCLIAYVLLQLVEIPQEFGEKLLDKLRYLQAFMCDNISYVHWLKKLVFL
ncbi:MAG: IS4 family transposase [Okeania sp. SIO2D1]|nr:IS4 family transposase [Okeania sp. SIO2D1]